MKLMRLSIFLVAPLLVSLVQAQEVFTPKPGTALRKAIMDGARPTISKDVGLPVVLKVKTCNVSGDWAFLVVTPVQKNGDPLDWSQSKYSDRYKGDLFHPEAYLLMKRRGKAWRVFENWGFEVSDVAWEGYWDKYGMPKALFDTN